jgi:hypothetical protein
VLDPELPPPLDPVTPAERVDGALVQIGLERLEPSPAGDHVSAVLAQRADDRLPQTAGGPGDQRPPPAQAISVDPLTSF